MTMIIIVGLRVLALSA